MPRTALIEAVRSLHRPPVSLASSPRGVSQAIHRVLCLLRKLGTFLPSHPHSSCPGSRVAVNNESSDP